MMNSHSSLETEEKVPATPQHQISIFCFEFMVFIGNMIWFHVQIGNIESFDQRQLVCIRELPCQPCANQPSFKSQMARK
jgi:hypothetical protein